ncbi:unnamed protein product [Urochloa decumbens]|uniref:F-box domain-containing protein n=1 Tax=Urochloa decumbens TaxID=240449 RepID=A0ABC9BX43_9POAL
MMTGTDALTCPVRSTRDWTLVSIDVLSLIFAKLDAFDVLMGAGLVCHSWLQAAQVPDLWRSVDMVRNMVIKGKFRCRERDVMYTMAKAAVDRSCGRLEVFVGEWFVDDDLFNYIGDRSHSLKSLQLISCPDVSNEGFADAIKKFPLLEELELSRCSEVCEKDVFDTVGKSCPQLKHLKLNKLGVCHNEGRVCYDSGEALGIATMTELRTLQLLGHELTNEELIAILENCPHLESLYMHCCPNVHMDSTLQAACAGIKTLSIWSH